MTFHKQQQGFTLIELLVVVAIIGILSSIVLAALGTARQRARDTAGEGTLSQVRAQAELDFGNSVDGFEGVCSMDLIVSAAEQAGVNPMTNVRCNDTSTSYAVSLEFTSGASYCVDSNGFAGAGATTTTDGDLCTPAS